MTSAADATRVERARFYTKSRKYPRMVGRLPEGTRIWGGPYSFTQLGAAAAVVAAALLTRAVWSTGSLVLDLTIGAGIAWGAALLARGIPASQINPIVVIATAVECAFAPRWGSYRGRAVREVRPRRVRA